ncbi:hypothetical protein L7F22_015061 [Adiantum nelumboides]|nr:hypothetical protein [Adiantum nelumboides]
MRIPDEDAYGTKVDDRDRLAHIVNVLLAFGSLISDLLVSRPFAMGVVSRAMTDAGIVHSGALQVVTRYLQQQECYCGSSPSEEDPTPLDMKGGFSVAFYPLYGSGLVVTNFILGTIVGRAHLLLVPQRGTHQCLVIESIGKWQQFRKTIEIGEGKLFSPSNLFVSFDNPNYGKLIKYYVGKKYTLRYTGGSGGSLIKILVYHVENKSAREGNIHKCVVSKYKGKAALLFEVAPMGLLIENASGYSGDGNQSVLDKVIAGTNDRTQVAYGSKNESFALRRLSLVCLASRPWSQEKWVMATSSGKKNDMPLLRWMFLTTSSDMAWLSTYCPIDRELKIVSILCHILAPQGPCLPLL